jgi:hypothetical protein
MLIPLPDSKDCTAGSLSIMKSDTAKKSSKRGYVSDPTYKQTERFRGYPNQFFVMQNRTGDAQIRGVQRDRLNTYNLPTGTESWSAEPT